MCDIISMLYDNPPNVVVAVRIMGWSCLQTLEVCLALNGYLGYLFGLLSSSKVVISIFISVSGGPEIGFHAC